MYSVCSVRWKVWRRLERSCIGSWGGPSSAECTELDDDEEEEVNESFKGKAGCENAVGMGVVEAEEEEEDADDSDGVEIEDPFTMGLLK